MKIIILLSLLSSSLFADELSTSLKVLGVNQTKNNQRSSGLMRKYYSCERNFKGTYAGNSIVFKPEANGGSGRYSHKIVYYLGEGYQSSHGDRIQKSYTVRNGNSITLTFPRLRDDTSFVQQSIMLITTDTKTDDSTIDSLFFNISRSVVLSKSSNPDFVKNECLEVYPGYQSPIGILSNASTNPSQLQIRQGIQKLWSSMSGSQWGFFFSPLAWTGLGNILMFNKSYFKQYSKQVVESIEVSSGYQLSPGDYIQIYEQRTRYVSAFDAHLVGVCGDSKLLDEEYMLQWWGVAYHAVPVNPYDEEPIPAETIGSLPRNTCGPKYTPDFSQTNSYQFVRTN